MALRKDPRQMNLWVFTPSQSKCQKIWSHWLLLCPATWMGHRCSLVCEGSAAHSLLAGAPPPELNLQLRQELHTKLSALSAAPAWSVIFEDTHAFLRVTNFVLQFEINLGSLRKYSEIFISSQQNNSLNFYRHKIIYVTAGILAAKFKHQSST